MAIAPEVEFRDPSSTVSPSTQVPACCREEREQQQERDEQT
jgi:hypothetical protein